VSAGRRQTSAVPLDPRRSGPGAQVELRARFAETDAMGVVHHASYLLYFEVARVELLRTLGHPYADLRADGLDFAVVGAEVRYEHAVRFDDLVRVEARLGALHRARFEVGYQAFVGGTRVATGRTWHAAVDRAGRPRRLPEWLQDLASS
jgi:acyl-CoA thioester hydrolase